MTIVRAGEIIELAGNEVIGCYVKATCCPSCDWFEQPRYIYGVMPPREVCPKCGERLVDRVGRYRIKTITTGFLFWKTHENRYIDFLTDEGS